MRGGTSHPTWSGRALVLLSAPSKVSYIPSIVLGTVLQLLLVMAAVIVLLGPTLVPCAGPKTGVLACGLSAGAVEWGLIVAGKPSPLLLRTGISSSLTQHLTATCFSPLRLASAGVVEREPIVTGKPSPFLMQDIAAKHGVQPSKSIMVGDRLDTDIVFVCFLCLYVYRCCGARAHRHRQAQSFPDGHCRQARLAA